MSHLCGCARLIRECRSLTGAKWSSPEGDTDLSGLPECSEISQQPLGFTKIFVQYTG